MIETPFGPLRGPLRVYEGYIREIIGEYGLDGKVEEFQQVGREAVYRAVEVIDSDIQPAQRNVKMYRHIRSSIRSAIG
ncbi:hypothetical protein [Halobacillus salinus]|uniref:hypothetical protein n=1 Tax=Halobacillus salinus TaxID=192814 RepID=UPI0009A8AFC3|nr:hypothetical protein [Halobacillus salinus]